MENGAKMEPKGEPKSIKLSKKGIEKMAQKNDAKKRRFINLRQHRTGSAFILGLTVIVGCRTVIPIPHNTTHNKFTTDTHRYAQIRTGTHRYAQIRTDRHRYAQIRFTAATGQP